jgi:hypothetical protein
MVKKLLNYVLTGVLAAVVSIGFAGCGEDYDDSALTEDISQVKAELKKAQADLKAFDVKIKNVKDEATKEAVDKSVARIEDLLKGGAEVPVKFEDLAPILGQLIALNDALEGLSEVVTSVTRAKDITLTKADPAKKTLSDVLVGYHYRIAALELQASVLGLAKNEAGNNYVVSGGILKSIQDEIAKLKAGGDGGAADYEAIAAALIKADGFIEAVISQINNTNPDLVTLEAKINALVTSLVYLENNPTTEQPRDLKFSLALSLVDYTFGEGKTGAIKFATGKAIDGAPVSEIYVRVSPFNARLDKDNIVLIDAKGNKDVNKYVKVLSVDAYTAQLTKAEAAGGIYKITFALGENYDEQALAKLTYADNSKYIAFAIAVETKTEAGSRYVATGFDTKITTVNAVTPVYNNLSFSVDSINVAGLRNRYVADSDGVKELVWVSSTNARSNVDPGDASSTRQAKDSEDQRSSTDKPEVPASIGSGLKVILQNTANIFAWYIDFDKNGATAAELQSWKNATIAGLDQVYTGNTATIATSDPALAGKVVGYRIYAVNKNGTLVDPDGRAFYVSYAGKPVEKSPLNFVYTVTPATKVELFGKPTPDRDDETVTASLKFRVTSGKVAFALPAGLAASEVSMYSFGIADVAVDNSNLVLYSSNNADPTKDIVQSWAEARYLAVNNINLTALKDGGEIYEGLLQLKDAKGLVLTIYDVTLVKNLPKTSPVSGLQLGDKVVAGNDTLKLSVATATGITHSIIGDLAETPDWDDLKKHLAASVKYVDDTTETTHTALLTYPSSDPDNAGDMNVNNWKVPKLWVGNPIAVTIGYDFGNVAYGSANPYVIPSTTAYHLQFNVTELNTVVSD